MTHVNIAQLEDLTDNNAHTEARLFIISELKTETNHFETLTAGYEHINAEHIRNGYMPSQLCDYRRILDEALKNAINENAINNKQVLAAL